ncbi:MAG: hypothetical protein DBY17_08305 [Oscillospiraceae bacterium]|nr:MAG: hypothetical protein DBY17_08305 [Oscillospiraceae bacterium]
MANTSESAVCAWRNRCFTLDECGVISAFFEKQSAGCAGRHSRSAHPALCRGGFALSNAGRGGWADGCFAPCLGHIYCIKAPPRPPSGAPRGFSVFHPAPEAGVLLNAQHKRTQTEIQPRRRPYGPAGLQIYRA